MDENRIGDVVIAAAMRVHSIVGPGLLESAYEACLRHELEKRELRVREQVLLPVRYDDLILDTGYRIDPLVEDLVVVELKVVQSILPVHKGQLLSYLKLGSFKLGYLLNFHVAHMRDGITRMANGLATASSASPPRPPR
ncbi:MAG TPA: GxxExxY protein [Stellaceae bacterium]|nr:GxxExxY protein [Stellaceae bacterium]